MINEEEVKEEFNRRAAKHGDFNAVLDGGIKANDPFSNVYRDFITKKGLLKTFDFNAQDTILDFGCGVGRLSNVVAPSVKKVIGVDVADKMIEIANAQKKFNNIEFRVANNESLQIPANSINKIISYWVLQHISYSRLHELLEEFKMILTSGGKIYIYEQIINKMDMKTPVYETRNESDYIDLFKQHGFELVKKSNVFRMPSYGMGLYRKIGIQNKFILAFCGMVEWWTLNRKPEFMDYHTCCFVFKKID